ncbi:cation:proton antiporter [Actinomyces vulturis]|uniref:cation:proton antiporter n=1 Tax=Actinomyces vulturis TaxID=1857645 RepID=UPI0008303909|nr:sodium:proton antiporter [Actinomyces vulturis]
MSIVSILMLTVLTLLVIASFESLGERMGLVVPLLLVALGAIAGLIPSVPSIIVDPQIILEGILPPLLFATAVSMPVMDFRRNLGPIATLSVFLVILTSLALGLMLWLVVPHISLAAGIAVGAIMSPTDAVATSIVRRLGVSHRIVTVLEGEGLINDASALVLLRSALAAGTGAISMGAIVGDFFWAVSSAVAIGWIIGEVGIRVRARTTSSAADTIISLAIPFIASIPTEHLGGSGLVAAVVAGLITGHHSAAMVPPDHRISARTTWAVLSMILEGLIFLMMGIQLGGVLERLRADSLGLTMALWVSLLALLMTIVVRSAVVIGLVRLAKRYVRRLSQTAKADVAAAMKRFQAHKCSSPYELPASVKAMRARQPVPSNNSSLLQKVSARRRTWLRQRWARGMADVRYYIDAQLGWREGTVLVWAGMRGAVTLAAAQTLPLDFPHRAFLVMISFIVAAMSLLLQGGTLEYLVRRVQPRMATPPTSEERAVLIAAFDDAAHHVPVPEPLRCVLGCDDHGRGVPDARGGAMALATRLFDALHDEGFRDMPADERKLLGEQAVDYAIDVIHAQREALLKIRNVGMVNSSLLSDAMANLDADQIGLEMRTHSHDH